MKKEAKCRKKKKAKHNEAHSSWKNHEPRCALQHIVIENQLSDEQKLTILWQRPQLIVNHFLQLIYM
ncbi:MAG: hypothetical protein II386_02315, partial [Bacteroidaceae bacterium]|nr:hypothetical protein [Bacteroidaceae bacterium]